MPGSASSVIFTLRPMNCFNSGNCNESDSINVNSDRVHDHLPSGGYNRFVRGIHHPTTTRGFCVSGKSDFWRSV